MSVSIRCFVLIAFFIGTESLIVPDEIPTILSVIYSNIPIFKKGTDSRFGWGFRLGNHADFQVLTELGPQKYTKPLANQDESGTNKRNTINSLSNTLWAQRQKDKQETNNSKTDGGKWLETWSHNAQNLAVKTEKDLPSGAQPGIGIGEIDAKSVIPDDAIVALLELYKRKLNKTGGGGEVEPASVKSTRLNEEEESKSR